MHLNADSNAAFPLAISSRLLSWTSAEYDSTIKKTQHVENLLAFVEPNHKNMLFFTAVLQRDSGSYSIMFDLCHFSINFFFTIAKLNAIAMIPIDYPNSSPMFSLELDWHGKHTRTNSEIIRVRQVVPSNYKLRNFHT